MKKKKMIKSMSMFGMFILLISFASAFAVSSRYWEENPILASPGETVDFLVVLQNIAGDGGDIEVEGLFSKGGDITKFASKSNIYSIPFGEKVNVNMSVTIPEDAIVNETIEIIVAFKIVSPGDGKQFGLGSSIEREIPIKIITKESESQPSSNNYNYYAIGLIILILAIIIYFLIKRKKN